MDDREIEERRRHGEGLLGELFLLTPNRFSPERDALDVLILGFLALTCLPVGPLAMLRSVRCADQFRRAGMKPPLSCHVGGVLGLTGCLLQIAILWHVLAPASN